MTNNDQSPRAGDGIVLAALHAARECIELDRTGLADSHMDPRTNKLDADGAAGVAEYDAVLAQIDAALAAAPAASVLRGELTAEEAELIANSRPGPIVAAPAAAPAGVGCKHRRYSLDKQEQVGHCFDCGAEGRMVFVVDQAPATGDQQ